MKILRITFIAAILAVLTLSLPSCSTLPIDTVNKQVFVLETGFNTTMEKVKSYIKEGWFNEDELRSMLPHLLEAKKALVSLSLAKELGDTVSGKTQVEILNALLPKFRAYLLANDNRRIGVEV